MEYFDINANNVDDITSIYVNDENKEKLTKVLASSFTKNLLELDLSGCKNLKGKLPVAKCKGLKKINIRDTQISNIDSLDNCTELEEAIVTTYNKHIELNFNSDKLKSLEIQLDSCYDIIKKNNLPNLETLKIYSEYNNIIHFHQFSKCFGYINIKNLYLTGSHLYCEYLNQLQELTFLRLDGCYIITKENTQVNIPSLKQVELHNIDYSYIQRGTINIYNNIYVKNESFYEIFINSNINKLYIYNCNIDNLFGMDVLKELEELYICNTNIKYITTLLKNNKLKTVYYKPTDISQKLEHVPENKHFEICYI